VNLYEILGIKRSASEPEIRSAYLKKAKQTHPDSGGDVAAFKDVARAYGVLGDCQKRIVYDETGREDSGPSTEDAAVIILRNLVEMIIADQRDPAFTDYAGHMKMQLSKGLDGAVGQIATLQAQADRCAKMAKRFKAKAGDNLIGKILEGRIAEMKRQITANQQNLANIKAAQALLQSYEYKIDKQPTYERYTAQAYAQQAGPSGWMGV
jgi:curved DNA-binding protein CbpA